MQQDWLAELQVQRARVGVADADRASACDDPRLYRQLVRAVKEFAIFMLDPFGHVANWNAGATRIKQFEEHEVIGRHFRMLYTEEDQRAGRPEKNMADALKYGQTEDVGWRRKRDGSRFWADVVITAVFDENGRLVGFAKVIRDLTEVNKAAAQSRTVEINQRMEQLKGEFLALISHELRTPLTTIKGFADLVEDGSAGPVTAEQSSYMGSLIRATEALSKHVDTLLDMASFRAGKLQLERVPMNFGEVVQGAVFAVQAQAQAKHMWLANHVRADLATVVADPHRISQVVIHLLENAIKFTPDGGRVDIMASIEGDALRCEVTDTGRGISQDELERLFKRFSQGDMSATRAEGGLGIGLNVSKELVETHGGRIGVLSAVGKGSTFWFVLPRMPGALERRS